MSDKPYLGQGIKYPHVINIFGRIDYESDVALIKQSLAILFETPLGTEFYREHYGSDIRLAMFEQNDSITKSLLDYYLVDAIARWERRINVIDVEYETIGSQPDLINCRIVFQVRQSSEIDSFIYPFYRELKN